MKIITSHFVAEYPIDREEFLLYIDPILIVILVGSSAGSVGQKLISYLFTVAADERIYSNHAVSKGKYLDSALPKPFGSMLMVSVLFLLSSAFRQEHIS